MNGEAIFDARPWQVAEGKTGGDIDVRFTQKGDTLYAILLDTPTETTVLLRGLRAGEGADAHLLGHPPPLTWRQGDDGIVIELHRPLTANAAHVFKIDTGQVLHDLRIENEAPVKNRLLV
ncbi:MAG: alpha-L-fucosidase C-terminal domain-containing protein [Caldilineaceae bacterium]